MLTLSKVLRHGTPPLAGITLLLLLSISIMPVSAWAGQHVAPSGKVIFDDTISSGGTYSATSTHVIQGAIGQTAVGWTQAPSGSLLDNGWPSKDKTAPTFSSISASPTVAKIGAVVTITATVSEPLTANPTITVNGKAATYSDLTNLVYSYTYTVESTDTNGAASIVFQGKDFGGNTGTVTNSTALTLETTIPQFTGMSVSPSTAKSGTNVAITFVSSEALGGIRG